MTAAQQDAGADHGGPDELAVALAALAASEQNYRLIAENSSDIVFRTSVDAVVEWTSPSTEAVLGWTLPDMQGRLISDFLHPDDREAVQRAGADAASGERVSFVARYRTKGGDFRWLEVTARPLMDEHGAVIGKAGSCRDVNAEVLARQEAERSQRLMQLTMDSAPSGMALIDLDRRFTQVNAPLARMLGFSADVLVKKRMPEVLHPEDDTFDIAMRIELLSGKSTTVVREVRMIRADGEIIWVQHGIGLLRDDDGTPLSYVSQFVDITDARESRSVLEHLATHDPLTGLLNRRSLLERMDPILAHHGRRSTRLAVLYLDVDGLKPVNDTHGHLAGDQLIVEVGQRIREQVREEDLASRLGGDEFVVVLPDSDGMHDALTVAEKLKAAIAAPCMVNGAEIRVTVSIGIAIAEPDEVPARVLQHADLALYRAKENGRDRIEVFMPE